MSRFKWLALASILTIIALTMLFLQISGEPQEQSSIREKSTVSIRAKGIAVRKTDEGREKMNLDVSLTLKPGERRKNLILIQLVEGEIVIDGTSYAVTEARGAVLFKRHTIVLRIGCSRDDGSISLTLHISYFWMGGNLYAVRGSGAFSEDGRTIILFRGGARVS
ncbi:MAG: hypothetical protein QW797_03430 [Thermoproteota archaeon]